jgi:predicted O-methyltransferase YrrM
MFSRLRLDPRTLAISSAVWLAIAATAATAGGKLGWAFHDLKTIATVMAEPSVSDSYLKDVLSPLPERYREPLSSLHKGEAQTGSDGGRHTIHVQSGVKPSEGRFMFDLCRRTNARKTMEVGLANGVSALYFLAALEANGGGLHTAMDPFETSDWKGIALRHVQDLGLNPSFRFLPEFSSHALPKLSTEKAQYDIVFIDGNHRFDDALVDFTLTDPVVREGGYILMHDPWLSSVQRAVWFIERNRSDYARRESKVRNVAVFQKTGKDARAWNHYIDF